MKKTKKGFTIVELVIVIAVIAILAAVLIPTFASVAKKARINADTQVVRNMNTSLSADEALNGKPSDFAVVLDILEADGYIVSNLNPTTDGWFYVWESSTNQMLLVDDDYVIQFKSKDLTSALQEPGATWCFAINDPSEAAQVEEDLGNKGVTIRSTITNVDSLLEAIGNGGAYYVDSSLEFTESKTLVLDNGNASVVLNLGDSALNTEGVLDNTLPISVKNGSLTINGGVISAAGSGYSVDGKFVAKCLETDGNGKLFVDGTEFVIEPNNGYISIYGTEASFKNAKITSNYMGLGIYNNAQVVFEDTEIVSTGRCVFVSAYDRVAGKHHGTSKLTIKSGTYYGKGEQDATSPSSTKTVTYPPIVAYSGDIEIQGGTFTSGYAGNKLFQVMSAGGSITITGGTFNGVSFEDVADWEALVVDGNVVVGNGVVTISK